MVINQIELLKQKLYKAIDSGNASDILKISRQLDKLILLYMKKATKTKTV